MTENKILCLADLRKSRGVSQGVVAQAMGISQPRVSGLEGRALINIELTTLRRYVEALGGTLVLKVDLPTSSTTFTL